MVMAHCKKKLMQAHGTCDSVAQGVLSCVHGAPSRWIFSAVLMDVLCFLSILVPSGKNF